MIVHRLSLDDDSLSVLMRTYLNDWLKPITCLKCEYFACAHRYVCVCVSLIVQNRQFGQRCYGHYAWLTMSATGLASFFVLSDSSVSVSGRYIFVAYREWYIASSVLFQLALNTELRIFSTLRRGLVQRWPDVGIVCWSTDIADTVT